MQRVDQDSTKLFAVLAAEMGDADYAWHAAAESAFGRLQVADPELAQLAIWALHSRAAAASFFARKFVYANTGSCYAALAHNKRQFIVAGGTSSSLAKRGRTSDYVRLRDVCMKE